MTDLLPQIIDISRELNSTLEGNKQTLIKKTNLATRVMYSMQMSFKK